MILLFSFLILIFLAMIAIIGKMTIPLMQKEALNASNKVQLTIHLIFIVGFSIGIGFIVVAMIETLTL